MRDVLAEFDGLSGVTARQEVVKEAGLYRATLEDLVVEGVLDAGHVTHLLKAMQARARPVKPAVLGVLGESHVRTALAAWYGVAAETTTYRCQKGTADGLPYVLELACGWGSDVGQVPRLCGYNFAPCLRTPFPQLDTLCDDAEIDYNDPVTLFVHLTCPRLDATDRGKTTVALPSAITAALVENLPLVTKRWTALKKAIRREGRKQALQAEQARRQQRPMQVKEAAWQVMEAAYLKASRSGQLPANARQIMYAARPEIIRLTGNPTPWKHSKYFTQTLLPDFMMEHPALTAQWDVVFDARGHFREPHTGREIGLGTLEVRAYIAAWDQDLAPRLEGLRLSQAIQTTGPRHRFRYALFVEKEGFDPLLKQANLEARYDLALMSTKGMSVTASRQLVEQLSQLGVTILVVHDFDKSGFEILDKFTSDTRRYHYTATPNVIDLGLHLEDALTMGLQSEAVTYPSEVDPRASLFRCGATADECAFLVQHYTPGERGKRGHWGGERIELNAMDSQQFLDWLEQKLHEVGVEKFVPDAQTLAVAYQHQVRKAKLQQIIDTALQTLPTDVEIPAKLGDIVRAAITNTAVSWDEALWHVVRQPHSVQG